MRDVTHPAGEPVGLGADSSRRLGRAEARPEGTRRSGALALFAIRVVNYLTNHVVMHLPSFTLRRLWYTRVLGARFGPGVGVHLGCYVWFYTPRQIRRDGFEIGSGTRINRGCCLDVRGSLRIGSNVSLSPEVMVLTASHPIDDPEFRVETRPVVIEDNAYVGSRAMVLPGVTLGRGCVVAAGSVVTRDVPPLAVVAGVPARKVGTRDEAASHYALNGPLPLFE